MGVNRGKQFEEKFAENWETCFPGDVIIRLHDQMSGYKVTSQNPCDFICFTHNKLFMIECKSHDGSSIPFEAIPQYERLLRYKNKKDVYPGIIVWFKDKDKVIWIPIEEAEKIYNSGEKSIGLRHMNIYKLLEIPSIKKRVFMQSDYSCLCNSYEE